MIEGIERTPVSSSNVESIGYDEQTRTLEVAFLNGSVYQYDGVPHHIYEDMTYTVSFGHYLWAMIKRGGYSYTKII